MTNLKISELDPVTDVQDADLVELARSGESKQIQLAQLRAGLLSGALTITEAAFPAAGVDALVIARTGEAFRVLVIDSDGNALLTGQGGSSGKLLVRQQGAPVAGFTVRAANDGSSDLRLYDTSGNVVHELSVQADGDGQLGLFGASPVTQPAAPTTLANLLSRLQSLGLFAAGGGIVLADGDIPAAIARDSEVAAAYQPLDSDLTSIAALSTTSFGRSLLALADAAALLAAAGAQASDSDLTALAGLNIAADKLPYGNGSHTMALADFTAAARALLDDADAAAMLVTLGAAPALPSINTQTDNYTTVIGDAGKIVEMNKATALTLTVPPNSSVAYSVGTIIEVVQLGAGQLTIAAGSGVTIRSSGGKLKLTGQYSSGSLYKRGTDEWVLAGDLSA